MPALFNGGGTGSIDAAAQDPSLSEVTAGSGFLASHLFAGARERYDGLSLRPALSFALQASRRPAPGMVTCLGGGVVASGEAGASRLPVPWLPAGLSLLAQEGAGEVQTPLRVPPGLDLLGAKIFFRPAKAGEPLERFNELLLVRGEQLEERARTYRGLGFVFG
jgi:D-serine deaminase-like pyridoxal phosphate-dependent protein